MKDSREFNKIIKAICHEGRADILLLLEGSKKEMCVNEISQSVGMSQSLTSHQLKFLESRDLIYGQRVGQTTCYNLCDNNITRKSIKILKVLIS